MTPYVRRYVTNPEFQIFEKIRRAVEVLPDLDFGEDEKNRPIVLSCHMLARAIGRVFSLKVVDGFFTSNCEHSWLLTPEGHIIDVYPVAVLGGPILVDSGFGSPLKGFYLKAKRGEYREKFNQPEFRNAVNRIAKELRGMLLE